MDKKVYMYMIVTNGGYTSLKNKEKTNKRDTYFSSQSLDTY